MLSAEVFRSFSRTTVFSSFSSSLAFRVSSSALTVRASSTDFAYSMLTRARSLAASESSARSVRCSSLAASRFFCAEASSVFSFWVSASRSSTVFFRDRTSRRFSSSSRMVLRFSSFRAWRSTSRTSHLACSSWIFSSLVFLARLLFLVAEPWWLLPPPTLLLPLSESDPDLVWRDDCVESRSSLAVGVEGFFCRQIFSNESSEIIWPAFSSCSFCCACTDLLPRRLLVPLFFSPRSLLRCARIRGFPVCEDDRCRRTFFLTKSPWSPELVGDGIADAVRRGFRLVDGVVLPEVELDRSWVVVWLVLSMVETLRVEWVLVLLVPRSFIWLLLRVTLVPRFLCVLLRLRVWWLLLRVIFFFSFVFPPPTDASSPFVVLSRDLDNPIARGFLELRLKLNLLALLLLLPLAIMASGVLSSSLLYPSNFSMALALRWFLESLKSLASIGSVVFRLGLSVLWDRWIRRRRRSLCGVVSAPVSLSDRLDPVSDLALSCRAVRFPERVDRLSDTLLPRCGDSPLILRRSMLLLLPLWLLPVVLASSSLLLAKLPLLLGGDGASWIVPVVGLLRGVRDLAGPPRLLSMAWMASRLSS
mmetsp:Transcript_22242/g.45440  ORF Transcript_22242/g.45440 Transcript_22242/m.45440 type:complete len:589 (+) Transcript_22242:2855-4621(+)